MSDALKQIWEKVDQMIGPQRMETEAEHIARDMREGRFPKRSDPIQVPVAESDAIARHLAPGDDLVERLLRVQWSVTGEPCANGNVDETCAHEAAARISALTAHNADLAAQNRDATKAIARMRARLARMEGGPMDDDAPAAIIGEIGNQIHNLSCELHGNDEVADRLSGLAGRLWNAAKQLPARAALTDGGSNG